MSGARMGHCEYCDKEHDLRVACFEYVHRKTGITKELWDDIIYPDYNTIIKWLDGHQCNH
jgi:hypothetical protein